MLGDTSDAATATQESFLKAFRGIRNFPPGQLLENLLYRIAIREALNHRRWFKRHLQKNVSIDAEPEEGHAHIEIEDRGATPFEQLAAMEIQVAVRGALQQVPGVFRTAVILRDLEAPQLRGSCGSPRMQHRTVKSRILRGRRALKELLEPLLGAGELHSHRAQTNTHGAIAEPQPSPFSDAFTAARQVTVSTQKLRPRGQVLRKRVIHEVPNGKNQAPRLS